MSEQKKTRVSLRMKAFSISDIIEDGKKTQQPEKNTGKTMAFLRTPGTPDIQVPPENKLLSSVLEEAEEEDFPEYAMVGKTIMREGEVVDNDQLLDDYEKLKTEVRRLEKLSTVLFNNTLQSDNNLMKTVQHERKKSRKVTGMVTIILLMIGAAITAAVYYYKEAEKSKEVAERKRAVQEKQEAEKSKESLEQQLTGLKEKFAAGISDEEKKKLLSDMREKYSEKDYDKYFAQLEKQIKAMEHQTKVLAQERKAFEQERDVLKKEREQMVEKLTDLAGKTKQLEEERLRQRQEHERELKELKTKLAAEGLSEEEKERLLAQLQKKSQSEYDQLYTQLEKQREVMENQTKALEKQKQSYEKAQEKLQLAKEKELEKLRKEWQKTNTGDGAKEDVLKQLEKRYHEQQKMMLSQLEKQNKIMEEQKLAMENQRKALEKERLARQKDYEKLLVNNNTRPDRTTPRENKVERKNELDFARSGRDIMKNCYRQKMVQSEIVETTIITKQSRIKATILTERDLESNVTKELIKIYEPSGLKGQAYLSIINNDKGTRSAWGYNPRENKTSRIDTDHLRDKILNTEFTYEDWLLENMKNYKYSLVQKSLWRKMRPSLVVLSEPGSSAEKANSQYRKKYYWIDNKISYPLQIKYFGKDNKLSKIFAIKRMKKVESKNIKGKDENYWRPTEAFIVNTRTGAKTKVVFENWRININLPDNIFTPHSLSRKVNIPK